MKTLAKVCFMAHWVTGLLMGGFILSTVLSGVLILFRDELDDWIYGDAASIQPFGRTIGLDSAVHIVNAKHPALDGIGMLRFPQKASDPYEFQLFPNDGNPFTYDTYLLKMNPYTGHIIREGYYSNIACSLPHWLYQFHYSLHLGILGLLFTACLGIAMLLQTITGIIVYRKHIIGVFLFKAKKAISKNHRLRHLHRQTGVWMLAFNSLIFFTGFWMNKGAFEKKAWLRQQTVSKPNVMVSTSYTAMLAAARQKLSMDISYLSFPTKAGEEFEIFGKAKEAGGITGNFSVYMAFDPVSQHLTSFESISDKPASQILEALAYPLHTAKYGGNLTRVLYFLLGALTLFLPITGFLIWWRRNRKPTKQFQQLNQNIKS
jgi:uncharacterized iron-regulated membrane protein